MQHVDVGKKRPTAWPWLLGLFLLLLVIWGVTVLLRTDPPPEQPAAALTASDTLPPVMIPAATRGSAPAGQTGTGAEPALTEDHIGERVRVDGPVLAAGDDGFWILTGSRVLRVESERRVRQGDTISVQGTVRRADSASLDGVASRSIERHAGSDDWTVILSLELVEERPAGTDSPGGG